MSLVMHEELQGYYDALLLQSDEAEALAGDLSPGQINWQPTPDEWSIAQCLDHLVVVNNLLLPKMEVAAEQTRERGLFAQGPFTYGWFGRLFIHALEPDVQPNMQAPAIYRPAESNITAALERFLAVQQRLIDLLPQLIDLDLRQVRVTSPALPLLRLQLGAWVAATVAHNWNHIRQAQRVRSMPAFPAAEPL